MTEESGESDDEIRQHRLPWRSDSTLICTLLSVHVMLRYTVCMSTSYVQTHTSSCLCHEIFRKYNGDILLFVTGATKLMKKLDS